VEHRRLAAAGISTRHGKNTVLWGGYTWQVLEGNALGQAR